MNEVCIAGSSVHSPQVSTSLPSVPAPGPQGHHCERPTDTRAAPTAGLQPWVRVHDGRWQRAVILNNLPKDQPYNGHRGWADITHLDNCTLEQEHMLAVHLADAQQSLPIPSKSVFLAGPCLGPDRCNEALVEIAVNLKRPGDAHFSPARLLVDSGCQLEGVLSADFVRRHGWSTTPSDLAVRTADGARTTGVRRVFANTRFTPGFTRCIPFGVLDLPGYDGIVGMGFLNQFQPFAIRVVDAATRDVCITLPHTGQLIVIPGIAYQWHPTMRSGTQLSPEDAERRCDAPRGPVHEQIAWQPEPPSPLDLHHIVSVFHIRQDSPAGPIWLEDEVDTAEDRVLHDRADSANSPPPWAAALKTLLASHRDTVFLDHEFPPFPPKREVEFGIQLEPGAQIPASPVHKLSPALVDQLRGMLKELLHNGLIVPTSSPYAAPLLMIRKPDGAYRICIDYRRLNAVTIKDRYPLPNPQMIFNRLAGCKFFSKLDLRWGYYQIRMVPEDIPKTAFRTPLGSFAWRVMGMGLSNAAPTFQRLMDTIFRDFDFVSAYLDDIMIASKTEEEHLQHLALVFARLREHGLIARESKCAFFQTEIKFLGYMFSANGKAVDPHKTSALREVPPPATVHALQQWLGAVNYYSSFIPQYAHISAPLTDLLKGTASSRQRKNLSKLLWRDEHQHAFERLKAALVAPPVLRLFDPKLPTRVAADSSGFAVGGVLEQLEDELWRPVAYYSRKLTPTEQRYTTRERECLAIKQCLMEWRHYLLGAPFHIRSDHESLQWLLSQNVTTLSDRLLRWIEYFSLFDFKAEYVPGDENVLPDALSRPALSRGEVQQQPSRPPTQVQVTSTEAGILSHQNLDLVSLAVLFQAECLVKPAIPMLCTLGTATTLQSTLLAAIRQAQEQDAQLVDVKRRLEQPGPQPAERMLYTVSDGLLVVPEADGRLRVVVPSGDLQRQICAQFHQEGGHQGVHRTTQAIAYFFYWPNMHRTIREFVVSCPVCQAAKAANRAPAGVAEPLVLPPEPGDWWTIDFIDLPRSANGHVHLLVCTERVSKLVILTPLTEATALAVANALVSEVFCWFGFPVGIVSDRGPAFQSAVFQEICNLLGITLRHSTPHTPHSHGDVERQNRIVNDILRSLAAQRPEVRAQWDRFAKIVQFYMNTAVVGRHGMSPLYLFFGRQPRSPAAVGLPASSLSPDSLEFVDSFRTRVQIARDLGRESQVRMAEQMDARRDPRYQYRVGEMAYLAASETPVPGENHFQCKWMGPFPILAASTSTVTLALPEHWQSRSNTFHVDKVKPYLHREGAPPLPAAPKPFRQRDPADRGQIACISHHRRVGRLGADGRRKTLQYFVHWRGLPTAYGEWLSLQHLNTLEHADQHIQDYCRLHHLQDP